MNFYNPKNKRRVVSESVYVVETLVMIENRLLKFRNIVRMHCALMEGRVISNSVLGCGYDLLELWYL